MLEFRFIRENEMSFTANIAANLESVREEIAATARRAGRDPSSVRLIAISKTFPVECIIAAYECGQRDFGENRVQEFQQKLPHLRLPDAAFHLIGHLQTNKAAQAMAFDCIETVDSERLAIKLNEAAGTSAKIMPVLIEVKLSPEETKTGAGENDALPLAKLVDSLTHLRLRGLMTVPPWTDNPEDSRPYFRHLRELRDNLQEHGITGTEELSMGMSRDFRIGIEEGATMVRVGTGIFGPRQKRAIGE
jgi:pyridoxal phosphate enzyme (YggS family)